MSIYKPSEHTFESLGITRGHFVYMYVLSDFENAPRVNGNIFIEIKNMSFQSYLDTCGRGCNDDIDVRENVWLGIFRLALYTG